MDNKLKRIDELDKSMEEPGFWEDPEKSGKIVQLAKNLKDTVQGYKELEQQYEDIGVMIQMGNEENDASLIPEIAQMLAELKENLEEMRINTLLSGEYDSHNAILKLNAVPAELNPATGAACFTACSAAGRRKRAFRRKCLIILTVMKPELNP